MNRLVAMGVIVGVSACSESPGSNVPVDAARADVVFDASVSDARSSDAPGSTDIASSDAPPTDVPPTDTPPPARFSATFSLLEVGVLSPAADSTSTVAQGIQIGTLFSDPAAAVAPSFDESPGSPIGCRVYVYDTPTALASLAGVNEGAVQVTVDNPGAMPDPTFPACIHAGAAGYLCPDLGSSQAPGAGTTGISATESVVLTNVAPGTIPSGTALLNLAATSAATFGAEDVGRYIKFSGTGNPATVPLDAAFVALPILARLSERSVLVALALPAATTLPITQGTFSTLAGVGPTPGLSDPGMLADDAMVSATFVGGANGGANHLGNFAVEWTGAELGDDFDLDATNANLLRNIPSDGSAFSVRGGTDRTADAVILSIDTTDALVAGLPTTAFPPPVRRRVTVRCAGLGTSTIAVPAAASAFLTPAMSMRTRVRATFVRASLGRPTSTPTGTVTTIAGHGIVGFTTVQP